MLSVSSPHETRRQELRGKRRFLPEQFENKPDDIHLALELKIIDDQISDCSRGIKGDRRKLQ